MKNRFHLHRARQKSRRQVTLLSKHASRKRCQGCGRTNYFHRVHTKKCDFCPCYFSTHRKSWDQVRLYLILGGQIWGTRMHAELRRPLFFSQAPHYQRRGVSSMVDTEESLRIPSSISQLNRLQAAYNRAASGFIERHYPYKICGPTIFREFRGNL